MIMSQSISSIRNGLKAAQLSAYGAALVMVCIAWFTPMDSIWVKLFVGASVTIPCILLGAFFSFKSAKSDSSLLADRKEIELSDTDLVIRKYKNDSVVKERKTAIGQIKGFRDPKPYLMIRVGLVSEIQIITTEFPASDIDALKKQLSALTSR